MRRFFRTIISSFIFLNGLILMAVCYASEGKEEIKHFPPPEEYQKSLREMQSTKSILPPTVTPGLPSVSPAFSPHIATPPIYAPGSINIPFNPTAIASPAHTMHNMLNIPVHAVAPNIPVPTELPQVPIFGNTIGTVQDKGSEKNGILWIEVYDGLFGQLILVKVKNLKNTPIVRQASIMKFEDIKIGDIVNIMFMTEREENIANFINIMTEEELEMMGYKENSQLEATEEPADSRELMPAEKEKDLSGK
ncbi:MAG: hypothetical protein KKC66_01840 [Candidatus Omnitrophica bacterium]|nr:hypothetical protein [Candidatus Omnitrophota bacterium]MBU1932626.1 hypothetical protein [Candidatus Omnitrophota bacterium]